LNNQRAYLLLKAFFITVAEKMIRMKPSWIPLLLNLII